MKMNSIHRVVVALVVSVAAATVHGAWLAPAFEEAGPGDARVRLATWDPYKRDWVYEFIGQGDTLRGAEGSIVELRPEAAGTSLSALPAVVEPFALGSIPAPVASPTAVPAGSLDAAGTPIYGRLRISQVRYQSGPDVGSPVPEVELPGDDEVGAEDFGGSVGIHNLTLEVGADDVSFVWDVSRWAKGDIFVGLNNATFKVLDRDGAFKRFVAVADYGQTIDVEGQPEALGPITTGCAANWVSGEVFATNFGYREPAVNVITRHPGAGVLPYADASRRLSTKISRDEDGTPSAWPIDGSPESVVFDRAENMFVGHAGAHYSTAEGRVMDINYLPMEIGGFIVDENDEVVEMQLSDDPDSAEVRHQSFTSVRMMTDVNGEIVFRTLTGTELGAVTLTVPELYYEDSTAGAWLENVFDLGTPMAARWSMGRRLHRYNNTNPGGAAAWAGSEAVTPVRDVFYPAVSRSGVDWIDLSSDQRTIFYTSEDSYVHRFDSVTGLQLPYFGGGRIIKEQRFHSLRILPPGDGSGGVLVAAGKDILRINADGEIVQRFFATGDTDVIAGTGREDGIPQGWYSLEVDPGARTFWASSHDTGLLYHFDIATGAILRTVRAVQYRALGDEQYPEGRRVEGLCVMWEYTAAQEECGDGIDNDGDGFIDEDCTPIESCSVNSPGDDDNDGFADNNDPDCSDELPPYAGDDSYVTNQGVALSVPVTGTLGNDGDPDNVDGDPFNNDVIRVAVVGTDVDSLSFAGVGTAVATSQGGTAVLQADGSFLYTPAPGFHGLDTFVYQVTDYTPTTAMPNPPGRGNPATVSIIVRPMVANDSYTMQQGGMLSVTGLQNSPNGIFVNDSAQPLSIVAAGTGAGVTPFAVSTTLTTANGATVIITANGLIFYAPLPTFVGTDSFVYQANDGVSDSYNTATVTITVLEVNDLVAVNDGIFSTPYQTAITQNLLTNDVDPEGHSFRITRINDTTVSNGTVVNVTNGTVRVDNVSGTVTVTPANGYSGLLEFTYTIEDQPVSPMTPVTASATVRVQVQSPNIDGVDDHYTTSEGTTLTIPASGILVNDGGSGALAVYAAGQPPALSLLNGAPITVPTEQGGLVTVNPNGSLTYVPASGFVGTDSFRYRLVDQEARISDVVAVFIDVTPRTLDAVNDTASTTEDTSVLIPVLTNDLVSALRTVTASLLSPTTTQGGTVEMVAGQVRYTPKANFCGTDTFTYRATDSAGQIDTATVTVTVSCVKDPAQAVATGGTFVYDGANHPGTCVVTGVNGESLSGTLTYTPGGATAPRTVGTYDLSCTFAGNTDYDPASASATVTITPKAATVTAGSGTKVYGTADTISAVASSGFVSTDLTSIGLSQARVAGENVGSYTTTATAVGAVLSNYAVSYTAGTFTITPAPVTVKAHDKVVNVGDPLPTLDGVWTGLVVGDGITATYSTTGTTAVAGTYPIAPTPVDPNGRLSNYTLTIIPGTLTVRTADTCTATGYTTYSQGGWGAKPQGSNPGAFLAANFASVYPNGLTIGGTKTLKFTSANAIEKYLPAGGSASVLTSSAVNPTNSRGVLSAQLLAVTLAVDFSAAGKTKVGLGQLVFTSGPAAGRTLSQVLTIANTVLGGNTSALPSGWTLSSLTDLLGAVVDNFHGGTVNGGLLGCGSSEPPCVASSFTLNQTSASTGTAGNARTATSGSASVSTVAFSRDKSTGAWAKAFLGAFGSYGFGVTDSSENGSGSSHTVDNSGRNNYVAFVFSTPQVVTKAYLGYVFGDSDAQVWVGTIPGASASTLMLSDAVLAGLGAPETSDGGSSARWMSFNAAGESANVVVIAAKTTESNDFFKVAKIESTCAGAGDTSVKSDKSDKSSKSSKSAKSGKSGKSGKSDKSAKSHTSSKSDKSMKAGSGKSGHSGKSSKSRK
jgi:hypothetical protein